MIDLTNRRSGLDVANLPPLYLRAVCYAACLTSSPPPSVAVQARIFELAEKRAQLDDGITDDEMAIQLMQYLPADLWPDRADGEAVDLES